MTEKSAEELGGLKLGVRDHDFLGPRGTEADRKLEILAAALATDDFAAAEGGVADPATDSEEIEIVPGFPHRRPLIPVEFIMDAFFYRRLGLRGREASGTPRGAPAVGVGAPFRRGETDPFSVGNLFHLDELLGNLPRKRDGSVGLREPKA